MAQVKEMTAARMSALQMRARTMLETELRFAANDCRECVNLNINPEYYSDEMAIYLDEMRRRNGVKGRCPRCGK